MGPEAKKKGFLNVTPAVVTVRRGSSVLLAIVSLQSSCTESPQGADTHEQQRGADAPGAALPIGHLASCTGHLISQPYLRQKRSAFPPDGPEFPHGLAGGQSALPARRHRGQGLEDMRVESRNVTNADVVLTWEDKPYEHV